MGRGEPAAPTRFEKKQSRPTPKSLGPARLRIQEEIRVSLALEKIARMTNTILWCMLYYATAAASDGNINARRYFPRDFISLTERQPSKKAYIMA